MIDFILVTFEQICYFRDLNVVTFYLYIYLILNEEDLTFTYSTNILLRLLAVNHLRGTVLPSKNRNVRPHSSNSVENVTS